MHKLGKYKSKRPNRRSRSIKKRRSKSIKKRRSRSIKKRRSRSIKKRRSRRISKVKYLDGMIGKEFIENNKCDTELLEKAVLTDDVETFAYVIGKCKNLIYKKIYGKNALMYAAKNQRIKIFKFLLDKGVFDINEQDTTGRTALMYAVVDTEDIRYPYITSMFLPARDDMYLMVRLLLEKGAKEEIKDKNGETYLDYGNKLEARYKFNENIAKIKENIVKIKTRQLFEELLKDNPDILRIAYLVNHGANVNSSIDKYFPDRYRGHRPIHFAATFCKRILANLFFKHGAKPDVQNYLGETALSIAISSEKDCSDFIKSLIANGANINLRSGLDMRTPLELAITSKKINYARTLIDSGADINTISWEGFSPLDFAIDYRIYDIAEFLISLGAKVVNIEDKYSTLHAAAMALEGGKIIRLILKRNPELLEKKIQGETPLYTAVKYAIYDNVRTLLELRANVNTQNETDDNNTPLHISSNNNISKLLLLYGAREDIANNLNETTRDKVDAIKNLT
jgi:ankyrin repeat protein